MGISNNGNPSRSACTRNIHPGVECRETRSNVEVTVVKIPLTSYFSGCCRRVCSAHAESFPDDHDTSTGNGLFISECALKYLAVKACDLLSVV